MSTAVPSRSRLSEWQRAVLPGDLVDGRRSAGDRVVDALVTAMAAGFGALAVLERWAGWSSPMRIGSVVAGLVALAVLWRRREKPTAVGLLCVTVSVAFPSAAGAAVVAIFGAVLRAPRRGAQAVVGAAAVATLITPALHSGNTGYLLSLALGYAILAAIAGWGLYVRARRALVQSLRERAQRLEDEQRAKMAQAREAERRRIATEMHDVLAHRVSLLSVHAGALEFRKDASPEDVAAVAGIIRAGAHSVLEELREVIGVLGDDSDDVPPPQPTLADLPMLVDESRAAGARVVCRIDVPAGAEPPAVIARTAYRVVQEGLTNARKHAPAAAVDVTVTGAPGEALVALVLSKEAFPAQQASVPSWGSGLIGLRERVTLAGGTLEHGPDPDGSFFLRADLPWSS